MGLPSHWIILLLVSASIVVLHGQDNAQTRIPDSLIECYRNPALRHPENRPPMTIQTFIDIIRKVETFQRGTVSMGELATSLLHTFRMDGIERTPGVVEGPGVLPFAVRGVPFFKHRLILRYLVPSNSYQFPNESLTQIELCTLHFMLSHSFDITQRGDEATVCQLTANLEEEHDRPPRHAIFKRQAEEEAPHVAAEEEPANPAKEAEKTPDDDTAKDQHDSSESSEDKSDQNPKDTGEPSDVPQDGDKQDTSDNHAEAVDPSADGDEKKSGKYIFDDDLPDHHFQPNKARSQLDPEAGGEGEGEVQDPVDPAVRQQQNTQESQCPVENGVVLTRWGTVSLGPVIAGLVAGLFEQIVPLPDLIMKNPPIALSPELQTATVDNRFGATLSGDLAEAALMQGPQRPEGAIIGLVGRWNSTILPRWYFNRGRDGREMTDAEIRGGLDGLVMGTNIRNWQTLVQGSQLRLSQLLSMYYSEDGAFSPNFRSCDRARLFSAVAPNDILEEQAFRFGVVLDIHSITSASIDNTALRTFVQGATRSLSTYLPQMNDRQCLRRLNAANELPVSVSMFTNITVVIDRSWQFQQMRSILFELATNLELSDFGSRITVVDGRTGTPFIVDARLALDVERNFTEAAYLTREIGLDIPRVLTETIQRNKEELMDAQAANNVAGGRSTIVLFIPFQPVTLNNNDLTLARDRVNHFRQFLPDVRFLYLAPGNRDNYRELVENPMTDVISFTTMTTEADIITSVGQVADRIRQIPLRLMNPTCAANWNGRPYTNGDFVHSVQPGGMTLHRLHPNYFFGVGSSVITVLGTAQQDLRVCYSRISDVPDNATNDVTCRQTNTGNIDIRMDNACDGNQFISQCRPLFISVRAPATLTPQPRNCAQDCALPTNIQYTIRNNGLECRAGVGHLISNGHLIALTAALIFLVKYLNMSS